MVMQAAGPKLVLRGRPKPMTLREHIVADFAALRTRLDESEKRILAHLDAPPPEAA
jgi:hypothetical protein